MSLVLSSREVSAGPTVGFQSDVVAAPSPAYVSNRKVNAADFSAAAAAAAAAAASSSYGSLDEKKDENSLSVTGESAEVSLESSSIGVAGESSSTVDGDDDDDEEGEEVQSKFKGGVGALGSLGSLEESLPIKRGLSNHYSGKSKSFANLSDVSKLEDLGKTENPFNKRRRILMSCKWSKNRSFYNGSLNPAASMPLLAVLDEDEEDQTEDHNHRHQLDMNLNKNTGKKFVEDSDDDSPPSTPLPRKLNNFKSGKCFSLTDLQNSESSESH